MEIKLRCKVKSLKIMLDGNQPDEYTVVWKICDEELISDNKFGKGVNEEDNEIYYLTTNTISLKTNDKLFSFISQHVNELFFCYCKCDG